MAGGSAEAASADSAAWPALRNRGGTGGYAVFMDRREMHFSHLMRTEAHIATGEELIGRQQTLLARLRERRQDTLLAEEVLQQLCVSQALHLADRDRLHRLLDQETH